MRTAVTFLHVSLHGGSGQLDSAPQMANKNPLRDHAAVSNYIVSVGKTIARSGRQLLLAGAAHSLVREVAEGTYAATVLDKHQLQVRLAYAGGYWNGECDCKAELDCKHCVAALLALQQSAASFDEIVVSPSAFTAQSAPQPVVPKEPPLSPLYPLADRLTTVLGRKLNGTESTYLRLVQQLYYQAVNGRPITANDLRTLTPAVVDYSWAALDLWPTFPNGYHLFWQHLAWEFRRRQIAIPAFMRPITDLSLIEEAMQQWERHKQVENWRASLRAMALTGEQIRPAKVELRLAFYPAEARVQIREGDGAEFRDLKTAHTRRLSDDHTAGRLNFDPESLLLWSALTRTWDNNWHVIQYANSEQLRYLNRAVSVPGLATRMVTPEGVPLARPAEPLRLDLHAAESTDQDYRFRLVRADGTPAPDILATMPGPPPLYLTRTAIFTGPPPHGLGGKMELAIPAPALETVDGVRFLASLGVAMPPRIAARTRRVKTVVTLTCQVKPQHLGSEVDAVFIRAEAVEDGGEVLHFGYNSWHPADNRLKTLPPSPPPVKGAEEPIPLVDRSALNHFPALMDRIGARYEGYAAQWRVRLTKTFPEQFLDWLASIPPEIEVKLDPQLASLRTEPVSGTVKLDVEEAGVDWFDLRVVLNVTDTELTQEELKLLLNAKGKFVRLGKKGWRRLQFAMTEDEDEQMSRLGLNARDFSAEPQRFHALQLADDAAKKLLPEQQAEDIRRRAEELKARVTPPIPTGIRAEMRPYQVEGFHFLAYLSANRFGGVLADDMGLGKTLQALAWVALLRESGPDAPSTAAPTAVPVAAPLPSLVVCPKSVMDNWSTEAERFLPGLRVRLWHGEPSTELPAARETADVIVVNYAQLRFLTPEIASFQWLAVILDEAQAIKNPDSQTAQSARALKAGHRLALTGTPIENRLLDLWSIFSFAMPGVLGNRALFVKRFTRKDDPFARRRLAARVRPFLLRRTKGQVARDLPDRIEEDILCTMEAEQLALYRAEFKRAQQLLLGVKTQQQLNEMRFNFLTSLLRLRQICCHPALISEDLTKAESAKVSALEDLLEPIMEEGHKVLVFSQFVTMLDLLKDLAKEKKWKHFYLAGDTENRGELVKKFQETDGAAVFLISLKAGGFGLNLTAASYVVLFDPWWNPAVERQAIDRTHRIGQTSKVIAYRLLMKDSIEQKIRQLQHQKAALAEDVLGEERFAQALTLDDLRYLFADDAPGAGP